MPHAAAAGNRYKMIFPRLIALLNQERNNNQLYVSLVEGRATYYADDKTMPALPASVLNVLQTERTSKPRAVGTAGKHAGATRDTIRAGVTGSYSLRIVVK